MMNMLNTDLSGFVLALSIGALFAVDDAQAATQSRSFYTHPAGTCHAALPRYESALRWRPLMLHHEGTGGIFITCSFTSQGLSITSVIVNFASTSGTQSGVSCVGVAGYYNEPTQYYFKDATLLADGSQVPLTWRATDFAGAPSVFPSTGFSISCYMIPQTGMTSSEVQFLEDVGG